MNHDTDYDILIAGGGMAGASMACALRQSGLTVAVIEAVAPETGQQPGFDDRTVALGHGSWRALQALGIDLPPATVIEHIHISEKGGFGITRIDHREENVVALGHVVENRAFGDSLWRQMDAAANVDIITPATVTDLTQYTNRVVVTIDNEGRAREISARLLIIADGGRSAARESAGFRFSQKAYGQTAIVANVSTDRSHEHTAWERFTGDGAIALLPMTGQRLALVWSVPEQRVDTLLQLPDRAFLRTLQQDFGQRAGRFTAVGKRASYPLFLSKVRSPVQGRTALIGNASCSMHPVAGQGFNRGLRDIGALAELVHEAGLCGADPSSKSLLDTYRNRRRLDDRITTTYTDGMIRTFTTPFPPLKMARNLGLAAISLLPGLRHELASLSMGEHARLPRLRRNIPENCHG